MRFHRTPRPVAYQVTARKLAALTRKQEAERDALPLLAGLIAGHQVTPAEEMQRRTASADQAAASRRVFVAGQWRDARARFYALPSPIRAAIQSRWTSWTGPANASSLGYMVKVMAPAFDPAAEDFPQLGPDERRRRTAELNDLARQASPYARAERIHSPGALAWLAPGFEPSEDEPAPRLHLHTSRGRLCALHHALAGLDSFGHNSDPTGERRAGFVELLGVQLRFLIDYRRHGRDEPSRAPWNADLTRRVLWIGLADEEAPRSLAP